MGIELLKYDYDLSDERDLSKFIKKIQSMCRMSFEYDSWQKRTKFNIDICPICNEDYQYIKSETHHHPETLFDVVSTYVGECINSGEIDDKTGFELCADVMYLHTSGRVNYIVLCESCHKKFHSGHPKIVDTVISEYIKLKK